MKWLRFDLKLLFLLMSNACLLAWVNAARSQPVSLLAAFALLVACGATGAVYSLSVDRSPFLWGPIGTLVALALMAISVFTIQGAYCLLFKSPVEAEEFFDDDLPSQVMLNVPVVLTIVIAPFAVGIGWLCAGVVTGIHNHLQRARTQSEAVKSTG